MSSSRENLEMNSTPLNNSLYTFGDVFCACHFWRASPLFWRACPLFGARAPFLARVPPFWRVCPLFGARAPFLTRVSPFAHAPFRVCALLAYDASIEKCTIFQKTFKCAKQCTNKRTDVHYGQMYICTGILQK